MSLITSGCGQVDEGSRIGLRVRTPTGSWHKLQVSAPWSCSLPACTARASTHQHTPSAQRTASQHRATHTWEPHVYTRTHARTHARTLLSAVWRPALAHRSACSVRCQANPEWLVSEVKWKLQVAPPSPLLLHLLLHLFLLPLPLLPPPLLPLLQVPPLPPLLPPPSPLLPSLLPLLRCWLRDSAGRLFTPSLPSGSAAGGVGRATLPFIIVLRL